MEQSVIQRIESLERSARRWKVAALVLAAALFGFSLTATFFFVQYTQATHALEAVREEAMAHEAVARQAEQAARRAAEAQGKNE